MQVESFAINKLTPYPENPRKNRAAVIKVADSIKEFGFRQLIVVDEDMVVLAGHTRLQAAKRLKLKQVPVHIAKGLTAAQAKAYRLMDNRSAEDASWDLDLLSVEITDLLTDGYDLALTGFSGDELNDLLAPDNSQDSVIQNTIPISSPEICKSGDLWIMGDHRLFCGDANDISTLDQLMGDAKASIVVTSPPYNQNLDTFKPSGMQKEAPGWVDRMASSYSDSMPEDEYQAWQIELFTSIVNYLTNTASLFYNHKIRYRDKKIIHPIEFVSKMPYRIRQEIVWARPGSITLNARMFIPRDERIYWMTVSDDFRFNDSTEIKSFSSVWEITPIIDVKVSAPFPVELPTRCINACSMPGDIVIDPFCGSGTTLIASHVTNRKCYAVEIDPRYCDVIIDRWQRFTEQEARCDGGD